jgi:hypothetical protein
VMIGQTREERDPEMRPYLGYIYIPLKRNADQRSEFQASQGGQRKTCLVQQGRVPPQALWRAEAFEVSPSDGLS